MGDGAWGSAIFSVLLENGHGVSYWEKGETVPDGSIVIMAIPTQAIREVLSTIGKPKDLTIINCAKGIEKSTHLLPSQIAKEVLGDKINYFALIGPSFAEEVKHKMPTLVNLAFVRNKNAQEIRDLFQNDYFRVRLAKGVRSLELASAFKNIYAIACGIADGLGYETNTRVKLILIAIEEFYLLSRRLGFSIDRKALPGTIGDLILTCNSEESRNFSFGKLLAKHKTADALKKIRETVEGYTTVDSIPYFEQKSGANLSLARFVYEVIKRMTRQI